MKVQMNYNTNYTKIDNNILKFNMSIEAKGLFCYMSSKPNEWKFTIESLARQLYCTEAKMRKIVNELMDIKLLKRHFENDERGYRRSVYTIYDSYTMEKENQDKNPIVENPSYENPSYENPYYGNQEEGKQEDIYNNNIYINNNKLNKEELNNKLNKESKKESNKERDSLKGIFEKNEMPNFTKKRITRKEKYIQAIKDYRALKAENPNLAIEESKWLEWCENVIRLTTKTTNSALLKQLKSSIGLDKEYLEYKIDKAIESSWQSPFFSKVDMDKYIRMKQYNDMYLNPKSSYDKRQEVIHKGVSGIAKFDFEDEIYIKDF